MIAWGHDPDAVWTYSPRQLAAFLGLAGKRRGREMAEMVGVVRLAMHGDQRQVKEQLKAWTKE